MSEDDRNQQESNGKHVKHRRKKFEIEKEFICGDPDCGRKYGTNAALYTHIKNKHNGIAPNGTIKPSGSKKGKDNTIDQQQEEEMLKGVEVLTDRQFHNFCLEINQLGEFVDKNVITRDEKDQFTNLDEDKIQDLYSNVLQGMEEQKQDNYNKELCKKAEQFLKYSSSYWKRSVLNELYVFLIMAYISKGYNFDDLQEDILKNPNAYKLLSEFRSETKQEQLKRVYCDIWSQIYQ
ncbi:hypothetical protein pb186bvf_020576 [Paramecium bursaria]